MPERADERRRAPDLVRLRGSGERLPQLVRAGVEHVEERYERRLCVAVPADRFRFEGAGATGPPDSPVVFDDAWRGNVPPTRPTLDVVERLGCDRDPVDAASDEGALTLTSYVWPDQTERLARLRGALTIARASPVTVVARGAADFVGELTTEPGRWTVLWHSVMWQYLDKAEQDAVHAHLERLGAAAADEAPLARVGFEPRRLAAGEDIGFHVTARIWPGSAERILGHAPAHGLPVEGL